MSSLLFEWQSSPLGGDSTVRFYRAFRCAYGSQERQYALGELFLVKPSREAPVSILQLHTLWQKVSNGRMFAAGRLYYRPEDTPKGRFSHHGQDEVLLWNRTVVLRSSEVVEWHLRAQMGPSWRVGVPAIYCPEWADHVRNEALKAKLKETAAALTSTESKESSSPSPSSIADDVMDVGRPMRKGGTFLFASGFAGFENGNDKATNRKKTATTAIVNGRKSAKKAAFVSAADDPSDARKMLMMAIGAPPGRIIRKRRVRRSGVAPVGRKRAKKARLKKKTAVVDIKEEGEGEAEPEPSPSVASVASVASVDEVEQNGGTPALLESPKEEISDMVTGESVESDAAAEAAADELDVKEEGEEGEVVEKRKKRRRGRGRPRKQRVENNDDEDDDKGKEAATTTTTTTAPMRRTTAVVQKDIIQLFSIASCFIGSSPMPSILVTGYMQYCRYKALQRRLQAHRHIWKDPGVEELTGIRVTQADTRILFCRMTFKNPNLLKLGVTMAVQVPTFVKETTGSRRRRRGSVDDSDMSSKKLNASEDEAEQNFMETLSQFLSDKNLVVNPLPRMGFQRINLYAFFNCMQQLGGYDEVSKSKLWRHVYMQIGGPTMITSAAASAKKHYEKYLLAFERHMRPDLMKVS